MVYFDYTATTPIDDEVLDTYIKTEKTFFANTTSLHKLGQSSNYLYNKATEEIKDILKIGNHHIVYTANATEANNLGIYGIVMKHRMGRIITTKIEHPSVYEVFKDLERRGYEVIYLDVDQNGIIDLEQLATSLNKETILVSIMWVNNIVGAIQPIEKVIPLVRAYPKACLHVDCVQGLCKIEPSFAFEQLDLFTLSAHKFYGPKGIGALIYRSNIELEKRLYGSDAQYGVKPGTISVGLIAALCKAIKKFYPETAKHYAYACELNKFLREKLQALGFYALNSGNDASPYIANISAGNINGETMVHLLEQNDIYISTGSACSSKLKKPERTVLCVTNDQQRALSSLRISLSHLTTKAEIEKLIEVLENAQNV
ncbi:MAG: cysteine desulfurase [Acholeplasmataceae bacterium]|jgi:cysteine desulfurase|nr:cysteine desulfurase [Acholeplasmataceae bacterium]